MANEWTWSEDLPSWAKPSPNAKVPTNLATWFGNTYNTNWDTLSSEKRDKYRQEYYDWVESMKVFGQALTPPEQHIEEPTTEALDEDGNPCSQSGKPPCGTSRAGKAITPPEVTPAPSYEISPEQKAWEEKYGTKLEEWIEAGGYGIPEETQAQMIQMQTDVLKAREEESLRVMRNNMERRGITNSGFIFANEQGIRSSTSADIANSIRDIQVKSALMKMASFEKAMGFAGQFLGYLSEQSQLKYQPEFATWQAEQMAKMAAWQETMDRQKMAINQAYQQQNLKLQAQLTSQLNAQQHQYDIELAQMELEAQQQAATAQGVGQLIGSASGAVATILALA